MNINVVEKYIILIEDSPKDLIKICLSADYVKPQNHKFVLILVNASNFGNFRFIFKVLFENGIDISENLSGQAKDYKKLKQLLEKIKGNKIIISNFKFDNIVENYNDYQISGLCKYYAELTKNNRNERNVISIHYKYHSILVNEIKALLLENNANPRRLSFHYHKYEYNKFHNKYHFGSILMIFKAISKYYDEIFEIRNETFPFCILFDFLNRVNNNNLIPAQKESCIDLISNKFKNEPELKSLISEKNNLFLEIIKRKNFPYE